MDNAVIDIGAIVILLLGGILWNLWVANDHLKEILTRLDGKK